MVITEPRHLTSGQEEWDALARVIRQVQPSTGQIRILEAGCGQRWPIDLADTPHRITGVDLDPEALRIRTQQVGDLDESIHGDLRTVQLPVEAFDVAYCSFVLEHVDGAERVLSALHRCLRPGGVLIIKVPDGDSVYGWVVKHSPHSVHIWYHRHVGGNPRAGEPGHAPYPTVYDPVVSLSGLYAWAKDHGMVISDAYCSNLYLSRLGSLKPVAQLTISLISALSRGKLSATHNNIGVVMTKGG